MTHWIEICLHDATSGEDILVFDYAEYPKHNGRFDRAADVA